MTMKQPKKDVLREQLALAADEIIRLRSTPWQRFLYWWRTNAMRYLGL